MPKVSLGQVRTAAEVVCADWLSRLGLKAAGKAQRLLGRLIREEKARRAGISEPTGGRIQ
jgi:hypothetical protein